MAEAIQYGFSHKEVAAALIREQGLKEGIWRLTVEFGLGAGNVQSSPAGQEFLPAAIVPIAKFGLIRVEKEDNLSIDASKLNAQEKRKAA